MTTLTPGGNAPLPAPAVEVSVSWTPGNSGVAEVDISAFLLQANRRVRTDDDMVFYGQRQSRDGAVQISDLDVRNGAETYTRFRVDTGRLDPSVDAVAFTATIGGGNRSPFSAIGSLRVIVSALGGEPLDFPVPLGPEAALITGEIYRRNGAWKFRAVGQGFNGGLKPLAESMGVTVADEQPTPPAPPPPQPAAPPVNTARPPDTTPPTSPPPKPVSLSKITLTKSNPTVSLQKKAAGYGEIRVNLNWNRGGQQGGGLGGFFSGRAKGVDLDLACLYELRDGSLGAIQALGRSFGSYSSAPYVNLAGDDRTGQSADGEWMRINGQAWSEIRRLLIYTFIYEGAPNWAATDGVVTVYAPDQPPIEVRLEDGRSGMSCCSIALIENVGGEMKISNRVNYYRNQEPMDRDFNWGLRWSAGSKD